MSPSDRHEITANSESKGESQNHENVKANGMNQTAMEAASSSAKNSNTTEHGTVVNIPLFTAKSSTLKCSLNNQMQTFDPGDISGEEIINKQCGYPLTFPLQSSSALSKNKKNFKAGSKINKLADMLAKRSQNMVEMTQNTTNDIISDIISAPKVEGSSKSIISEITKADKKNEFSDVFCVKTVSNQTLDCINQSLQNSLSKKSGENSKSNNWLQLQLNSKFGSNISEFPSNNDTTEFNALKELLLKPETDESTKPKKEVRKNLKNVELSLILPEKKRRSPRKIKKLAKEIGKDLGVFNCYEAEKSNRRTVKSEESAELDSLEEKINSDVINNSSNSADKMKLMKQRRSRRLVETSTQTTKMDFIGLEGTKPKIEQESHNQKGKFLYACMYCKASFVFASECKNHEKSHSPKKSKQITKCQFCSKKLQSLYELKSHCIKSHPNKYAYCVKCDERFCEKTQLYSHNKLIHLSRTREEISNFSVCKENSISNIEEKVNEDTEKTRKPSEKKACKSLTTKSDLKVDVTFDPLKKPSTSPRSVQKLSPRENKTEEQLLEMEMLFYSHISGNIKENLTNHLDGKIDTHGNPIQNDERCEFSETIQSKPKYNNLLSIVTSDNTGVPSDRDLRSPSPYQTRSKTPNPLPSTAKKFKKLPNWQQKFWEKYNFPTNYRYEHRFWDKNYLDPDKSALYLKDLSCLDIKTQLTMKENIKKLEKIKSDEEMSKSSDEITFPEYLSLVPRASDNSALNNVRINSQSLENLRNRNEVDKEDKKSLKSLNLDISHKSRKKTNSEIFTSKRQADKNASKTLDGLKMMTRRQSVIELNKGPRSNEDTLKRRKGSLDVTGSQKMTLRRQTSLDNLQKTYVPENSLKSEKNLTNGFSVLNMIENENEKDISLSSSDLAEISGEWVRPRSYLCGTCCSKFTNLWELEDHKWVSHPNVWCTHYEFEDEKIEKLFERGDAEENDNTELTDNSSSLSKLKLTDLYKRYLLPHGSLKTAKLVPNVSFPEQCTKCKKNCMNSSEMHKHMLDCGGDTTWFLTMYSSPMAIKRKWRPFGSRRRKQIGRRMLKRNIPNTSNMRPYHYQHRIRTKPGDVESIQKMLANLPEKRTRRAINFDEIKTRSQATIHSNRLLRKRFKVSFGSNFMRLKALKQQRQVKTVKKENSSKSTTDASSENTPLCSPKRRSKPKEPTQSAKENSVIAESAQEITSKSLKMTKKKTIGHSKKKDSVTEENLTKDIVKKEKKNMKNENNKPLTRSNSIGGMDVLKETFILDKKRKMQLPKNVKSSQGESFNINRSVSKEKKSSKEGNHTQKKKNVHRISDKEIINKELVQSCASDSYFSPKHIEKTSVKKKMKTDPKEEKKSNANDKKNITENSNMKKKKAGKLPNKNILRLKSNEKEKTELIKRIRKTLRNSKRILEKRENKEKYERRRSLRIKTLQSTEMNSQLCETVINFEKKLIEDEESISSENKSSFIITKPVLSSSERGTREKDKESCIKKSAKVIKDTRYSDIGNVTKDNENLESPRSLRIIPGLSMEEKFGSSISNPKNNKSSISNYYEKIKDESDLLKDHSFENNEMGLYETTKTNANKEQLLILHSTEDRLKPLAEFEVDSRHKLEHTHNVRKVKENESELIQNKNFSKSKTHRKNSVEELILRKSNDLSEMPILDKEEPLRNRTTRKNETEIPILMPFEYEKKNDGSKERIISKRKDVCTFNISNKKQKSNEKFNPLKTVKEADVFAKKKTHVSEDSVKKTVPSVNQKNSGKSLKKRKRNFALRDSTKACEELPKSPKIKKYFLDISPSEIDKGGESKDESSSDSEPLITLVKHHKHKQLKASPPAELSDSLKVDTLSKNNDLCCQTKKESVPTCIDKRLIKETKLKDGEETKTSLNSKLGENLSQKLIKDDSNVGFSPLKTIESSDSKNGQGIKFDIMQNKNFLSFPTDSPVKKFQNNVTETGTVAKQKVSEKKSSKSLKMTVKLKEATLKILDNSAVSSTENKWNPKATELCNEAQDKNYNNENGEKPVETKMPEGKIERRCRRASKEIKSSNEFIIDDPLLLVDELWSDLDSDSDDSKKRSKKAKKKNMKKKNATEKKDNNINLEELLRNFGESKNVKTKENNDSKEILPILGTNEKKDIRRQIIPNHLEKRRQIQNSFRFEQRSYKRLSLRLFNFHKKVENFGSLGLRLSNLRKGIFNINDTVPHFKSGIPTLPFLAAEIKENPVQIIQCSSQKNKIVKKNIKKSDSKISNNIQLKISLPLQSISNLAALNNNHLTEVLVLESTAASKNLNTETFLMSDSEKEKEAVMPKESFDALDSGETMDEEEIQKDEETVESDFKLKAKRSDMIDKIFYCEICETYYYSSSQLKIHKLSNRHKLKETELSQNNEGYFGHVDENPEKGSRVEEIPFQSIEDSVDELRYTRHKGEEEEIQKRLNCNQVDTADPEKTDPEKLNDDTSEMPVLEGPFLENPFVRFGVNIVETPPKASHLSSNSFGFSEACLKDIQRAIGCTDEEMLILTLLGEDSIEIENEILDLDSYQRVNSSTTPSTVENENENKIKEREKSNGLFKPDFKKRITSALARLVNKAVLNLLLKYKNTNRTGISPEALSFLIKISKANNRKNLLELNELLNVESEGESSKKNVNSREEEIKEKVDNYKYANNIHGNQLKKEPVEECHIIRSHKSKGKKNMKETSNVSTGENKNERNISYYYSCSICGSHFDKESTLEYHLVRCHKTKKKKTEESSSSPTFVKDDGKKDLIIPYKYLCTICGSRFEKESTWEYHKIRSHRSKGKKNPEELQTNYEDDWSNTWIYDIDDELPGNIETPQFLCSDCGINFTSPQEVLEHQKSEHGGQKNSELSESGPLQSSTIGSSDEIIKGRKTRKKPKHFSKAELDQQRIIANNELRKLDRKLPNRNKGNKIKWGVDALKFTVEKEDKNSQEQREKEILAQESPKSQADVKNVDVIPKLNLSRTNNIPEFKIVQKASCINRFQRIIDNKMKRKTTRNEVKEIEDKEHTDTVDIVKKGRKRKINRYREKKHEARKEFDVYDFNDSESEPEPVVFSHVKKVGSTQASTKLKLVKVREVTETSKNKADSTTKDIETEDYDSEDSLPLAVVKRTKAEDDEEIRGDNQNEKPDGILEKVEYLIEQLENDTNQTQSKKAKQDNDVKKIVESKEDLKFSYETERSKDKIYSENADEEEIVQEDSQTETFRMSLENKFLQLENKALKINSPESIFESQESISGYSIEKVRELTFKKPDEILQVADSSQDVSDEEDSLPLLLMSKKNEISACDSEFSQSKAKKEYSSTSEILPFSRQENSFGLLEEEEKTLSEISQQNVSSPKNSNDGFPNFSSNENKERSERSEKYYDTLNGNVIYRRNDSLSEFESDSSEYGQEFKNEKTDNIHEAKANLIKEVMEREDVVIVCSRKEHDNSKISKKKLKESPKKRKQATQSVQKKKKILPLLSVTLEENFRKSESPKLKKDVIVKKIWSRHKFTEDALDENSHNSVNSQENKVSLSSVHNEDSHSEIDKEIIVKKIWNKKRLEHDIENGEVQLIKLSEKPEDVKINQTEISDEIVIKCGPKAKAPPRRRKSRNSTKESSKEKIMRKIWSGKCTFQTKAALKTYDSDILPNSKDSENFDTQTRAKRRGRPPNFLNSKKTKTQSEGTKSDEDDLESLLEEIEREEVEKAIRLEFLQLRRSDKANIEISKENGNKTVGLFAETYQKQDKELADKKRRKIRKNLKNSRKNLIKRRKFIKKPMIKSQQVQPQKYQIHLPESDEGIGKLSNSVEAQLKIEETGVVTLGVNKKSFDLETKIKNHKHKKHRHKHHHHKHKHKKSKHHKYVINKHKVKHKSADCGTEKADDGNFTLLENICQDIPSHIEKQSEKRFAHDSLDILDTKLDEILMSTSHSFEGKTRECDDVFFENVKMEKERNYETNTGNVYDFVEDDSSFLCELKDSHKN